MESVSIFDEDVTLHVEAPYILILYLNSELCIGLLHMHTKKKINELFWMLWPNAYVIQKKRIRCGINHNLPISKSLSTTKTS